MKNPLAFYALIFVVSLLSSLASRGQEAANNARYIAIHYCLPGDENRVEQLENQPNTYVLKSSDGTGYLDRPSTVMGLNGSDFFLVPADVSYYYRVSRDNNTGKFHKYCVIGTISVENRQFGRAGQKNEADSVMANNQTLVMVFPNPAQDYFTVVGVTNANVYVFNHTGTQVLFVRLTKTDNTVDVSSLGSGIYTIKIEIGSEIQHVQLVVQR
jgi:hypothetical protein